jgi:hypothetical protein
MKIKKWTLALSGLALLSSCTTNGPSGDSSFPGSSSEGDFSSSSSEAPSSESAPESFSEASSQSQAEAISDKVYAVLEGMKAGNYSLSYVLNGKELTDIVTPSYCYTGYLNSGSILLKTYKEAPFSYDFTLNSGKLEIRGQSFKDDYSGQGVRDLSAKNSFASYKRSELVFYKEGSSLSTLDATLIDLFSAQLDFTGIKRILFRVENGNLVAEFQGIDDLGIGLYQTVAGGVVTIHDLGTSSLLRKKFFFSIFSYFNSVVYLFFLPIINKSLLNYFIIDYSTFYRYLSDTGSRIAGRCRARRLCPAG